jgi:hypothetical protein
LAGHFEPPQALRQWCQAAGNGGTSSSRWQTTP